MMEIKIYCDASVKIENFNSAFNVKCSIVDYKKDKDTLSGNILITGEFIKDNLDEKYPFSEVVPFSIVFKDGNFKVDSVVTKNFTYQEVVNQGIEANFNIVVKYQPLKTEPLEEVMELPSDVDYVEYFDSEEIPFEDEYIEEKTEEPEEESIEIPFEEEEIIEVHEIIDDELTKELINQKYDELLKEILDSRTDNFFETPETKSNIKITQDQDKRYNLLSMFDNIKAEYSTIKVRYIEKESDLERISKKEKVSIDKIYKDNKNNNFFEHRRIIIK